MLAMLFLVARDREVRDHVRVRLYPEYESIEVRGLEANDGTTHLHCFFAHS